MPSLTAATTSNQTFRPTYIPVAVFAGGTSGVGQAMAEALARQLNGRAHIILIGRNERAAQRILASFPKPQPAPADAGGGESWVHEFLPCDAESMRSVRAVCADLRARLTHINFLVMSAAGPRGNSLVESDATPEGLDDHLAMRYFSRYLYSKELLPLVANAEARGQPAHVMTVLGAGFGMKIPQDDLGLHDARRRTITMLRGAMVSLAAIKGMIRGVAYNDGLVAHFASKHPALAFSHISPGQVQTEGAIIDLGWLLSPLTWLVVRLRDLITIPQDDCAQYMLYALLEPERGLFIRNDRGDVVSARIFPPDFEARWESEDQRAGFLDGVAMKGYGGSDAAVARLIAWTEEVLAAIPS
ncbi:hypothetical protein GGX14DRAFT_551274 [Mycena pura]|uniref:NAD(P)-binding protein n=1 Tax=Mycena pura TaxID=153505 RepID=A0AAD6VCC4_9AGAR|nr:hypothetical protein GGX14DRAFT_551274 [Mycena pura]